jgi:hypothetical protein
MTVLNTANTIAGSWNAVASQAISEKTNLPRTLVNLITQYLPPIDRWITEWTGERGREIVTHAVTQAKVPLADATTDLVVQYLKKSDIFGIAELEKVAAGRTSWFKSLRVRAGIQKPCEGREELTKLLGKYRAEGSFPVDIDDEMQAELLHHFDDETLEHLPDIKKVTELYSLYWCPKGMTIDIVILLMQKQGKKLQKSVKPREKNNCCLRLLQENRFTPTQVGAWIQFPNAMFRLSKTVEEQQQARVPAGFELPHITDALFCVFVKRVCMRTPILYENPNTYWTCTQQQDRAGGCLVVGGTDDDAPVNFGYYASNERMAVGYLRKYCSDNAT